MKQETKKETCKECKYLSVIEGAKRGQCRRFPASVSVVTKHWCGEFAK